MQRMGCNLKLPPVMHKPCPINGFRISGLGTEPFERRRHNSAMPATGSRSLAVSGLVSGGPKMFGPLKAMNH